MALKQATIFKDFRISTDSTNDSVKFQKVEPKTVSVKNDNFATQVEIYDASDEVDFFAYKYITFDNSAIFEITDCIKNEKYTTLFIQYLSNITFDTFDENFRVDSISIRHMQDLGLDINQLFSILGNQAKPTKSNYSHSETASAPFMYAVRLRFASIPQNLTYGFTYKKNEVKLLSDGGYSGGASYSNPTDPSTRNVPIKVDEDILTDPTYSAILPIPYKDKKTYVGFTYLYGAGYNESRFEITTAKFINTLKSLLSDLVISAELILLSNNQLCLFYPKDGVVKSESLYINYSNNEYNIGMSLYNPTDGGTFGARNVVCASEHVKDNSCVYGMPIFLNAKSLIFIDTRIIERLAFYKLPLSELNSNNKICLALNFLGNRIDISKIRKNGSVYVKNNLGSMRVYIDFERNIYQDIQTEIEYSKSAFSNYNAYKKSNIELTNSQKNESLRQLQKQQRGLQALDTATGLGETLARSAFAFGTGGVGSGAGVLLGGVANAVTSEIKFNATQQNALANERLAQRQAHEYASSIIVPESFVSGEISFINSFTNFMQNAGQDIKTCLYTIEYVTPDIYLLSKKVFNDQMTEKIEYNQPLPTTTKVFSWYPATYPRKIYQAFITTRNPVNNRKDFTIYCTD